MSDRLDSTLLQPAQTAGSGVLASMMGQLDAAARFSPAVNLAYASLLRDFYATLGLRMGLTAEAAQARYPLKVRADALPADSATAAAQASQAAFLKWSHGHTVVALGARHTYQAGKSVVVHALHGTLNDFTRFEHSKANIEADQGAGFYFTDNKADVGKNYAVFGPDLTAKVARLTEQIEEQLYDSADGDQNPDQDARAIALQRLVQHDGFTMPVYVRFDNPLVVGGARETVLTYEPTYDDENEDYLAPTGTLIDFVNALRHVAGYSRYDGGDIDPFIEELMEEGRDSQRITASHLLALARKSEQFQSIADYEQDASIAASELVRQAFERMGFDGIIDQTVYEKFGVYSPTQAPMAGMTKGTTHFIAFKPEQIKSAIGNRGTWDEKNPDILNQLQASRPFRLADLPRDMREELFNEHAMSVDPEAIEAGFVAKRVPSGLIDLAGLVTDVYPSDQLQRHRDAAPGTLPPIVIADGRLLDGGHRISVARERGESQLRYIDLSGLIDTESVGYISELPARAVLNQSSTHLASDTRADGFQRWFDGSAVVDGNGAPLLLFHGTNKTFDEFDHEQSREDGAIWLTPSAQVASDFALYRTVWGGANVMPVYVKADRLLIVDGSHMPIREVERTAKPAGMAYGESLHDFARRTGFDGVVFKDVTDDVGPDMPKSSDVYALFETAEFKSAIGNRLPAATTTEAKLAPQAKNRAFTKWFSDSKVVDTAGAPRVVFHGTNQNIVRFAAERLGQNTGAWSAKAFFFTENPVEAAEYANMSARKQVSNAPEQEAASERFIAALESATRRGDHDAYERITHEFEASEQEAMSGEPRGANILPVYLSIKNPLVIDMKGAADLAGVAEAIALARSGKFDGLRLDNVFDAVEQRPDKFDTTQWVALRPEQIKSAIGNRGTWNPKDPSILNQSSARLAFRDWFAASQVVDAGGAPLTVFHGTVVNGTTHDTPAGQLPAGAFTRFSKAHLGSVSESSDAKVGFWFSASEERAWSAAGDAKAVSESDGISDKSAYVYSVNLSMQNPLLLDDVREYDPAQVTEIAEQAKLDGHDGLIFATGEFGPADYLVFEPEQIKSTLAASFSSTDPSILKQPPSQVTASSNRGEIRFGKDITQQPSVMTLFEGADKSTIPHEAAHFWLEVYSDLASRPDAPADVKDDMNQLLDWFGIKGTEPPDAPAENLAAWFGDSKVVDAAGAPLLVFHGTKKTFESFDKRMATSGFHFGSEVQAKMRVTGAGQVLMPAHLAITRPRRSKDTGGKWAAKMRSARSAGHNGIVYLNRYEGIPLEAFERAAQTLVATRGGLPTISRLDYLTDAEFKKLIPEATDSYIAFEPEQIRSAAGSQEQIDSLNAPLRAVLHQDFDSPAIARAASLAAWFAGSKVVRQDGSPMPLYHGTTRDFKSFDLGRVGTNDHGWYGRGVYLSSDPGTASAYTGYDHLKSGGNMGDLVGGGNVMPVYASLQNPYVWPEGRTAALTPTERDAITQELIEAGHDGVIVPNKHQDSLYADFHEVIVFDPAKIKSVFNNGAFDPNETHILHQGQSSPERAAIKTAAGTNMLLDDHGLPLLVYRGEHSQKPDGAVFHSRGNSLTFGSLAAAELYSTRPNHVDDASAISPRIIPAHLRMSNPISVTPDDPFIELGLLAEKLGFEEATRIAVKFSDCVQNTGMWEDEYSASFANVATLLASKPEALSTLYFNAYEYLDDADEVDRLKEAGFDGAIHMGNGATHAEVEYRVFDARQAVVAQDSKAYAKNLKTWMAGSKVVDKRGAPLRAYHGATNDFSVFRAGNLNTDYTGDIGAWFSAPTSRNVASVRAAQTTAEQFAYDQEDIDGGNPLIVPVYLSIKRPVEYIGYMEFEDAVTTAGSVTALRTQLEGAGFDGLVIRKSDTDFGEVRDDWVAFNPAQIKSAIGNRGSFTSNDANILHQPAFHGTPHLGIEKFETEKIGTGEGNQTFGWGLYFASQLDVAEHYRLALTRKSADALHRHGIKQGLAPELSDTMAQFYAKARAGKFEDFAREAGETSPSEYIELFRNKHIRPAIANGTAEAAWKSFAGAGQVYQVTLPADEMMLLWDRPWKKQPSAVRDAIENAAHAYRQGESVDEVVGEAIDTILDDIDKDSTYTGCDLYECLGSALGKRIRNTYNIEPDPEAASRALAALGVKGIRYFDGSSRLEQKGSSNYVIFSGDDVSVVGTLYQSAVVTDESDAHTQLRKMRDTLEDRGVQLDAYMSGNVVTVSRLFVAPSQRKQGLGSKVMSELAAFADSNSAMLCLSPSTDFGATSVNRLKEFYKRFGFVENRGRNKDFTISESMLRSPALATMSQGSVDRVPQQAAAHARRVARTALETWRSMSLEQRRPFHEQFARGFEAFLMEGKAPTPALQGIFGRFKAWFTAIYKSLAELKVTLTPEVRGVMARMLGGSNAVPAAMTRPDVRVHKLKRRLDGASASPQQQPVFSLEKTPLEGDVEVAIERPRFAA